WESGNRDLSEDGKLPLVPSFGSGQHPIFDGRGWKAHLRNAMTEDSKERLGGGFQGPEQLLVRRLNENPVEQKHSAVPEKTQTSRTEHLILPRSSWRGGVLFR